MMVSLKGKVKVIDKSDWPTYKKKGYIQAFVFDKEKTLAEMPQPKHKFSLEDFKYKDANLQYLLTKADDAIKGEVNFRFYFSLIYFLKFVSEA